MHEAPALPYGAVMATAVASGLASSAGVGFLRLPLLWLAVAVGVAIPVVWRLRGRSATPSRRLTRRPPDRFGAFTVPIGLAAVGGGLARLDGPVGLGAAAFTIGFAWTATAVLAVAVVVPVAAEAGATLPRSTWFLAPAALLADANGIASLVGRLPPPARQPFGWVALGAAGAGAAGYAALAVMAVARVATRSLDGSPGATWWIAAGCGGLAAAALGRVGAVAPFRSTGAWVHGLGAAALGLWATGTVVLVPVLAGSLWFLAHLRHLHGNPPWPPTFSTGVYALGTIEAGRLLAAPAITAMGDAAAAATIVLWVLTVLGHAPARSGR